MVSSFCEASQSSIRFRGLLLPRPPSTLCFNYDARVTVGGRLEPVPSTRSPLIAAFLAFCDAVAAGTTVMARPHHPFLLDTLGQLSTRSGKHCSQRGSERGGLRMIGSCTRIECRTCDLPLEVDSAELPRNQTYFEGLDVFRVMYVSNCGFAPAICSSFVAVQQAGRISRS